MSKGRGKHVEVEDQSGNFVLLLNDNIDAMKKVSFILSFCR